jgi:hypothetical protein
MLHSTLLAWVFMLRRLTDEQPAGLIEGNGTNPALGEIDV